MRPIYKAALLCSAAFFWNCSHSSSEENNITATEVKTTNVSLKLTHPQTPLIDSLVLDCYGADTIHMVHDARDTSFSMDLFPSDHWIFKAKIYANGGLMQRGELETKLTAGGRANLNIQMHPIVGFVYVEIPLGLNNNTGIKSGEMILSSSKDHYTIPMTQTTSSGIFRSDMLNLGANYDVIITLYDVYGKEIYKLKDKFLLTEDSPIPTLALNALRSKVALSINLAPEKNVELTLPLPAGYRKPKEEDLLITEVMAAPDSKDSSQYEFVEIYNGSLDTLILDDCTIGLTSSSSTKFIPLTISEIPPNEVLVLGNPNSGNTPPNFIGTDNWNDLGNSKGMIILKCDGITLDSLYYSATLDSLHTNVVPALASGTGKSAQLKIDQWKSRKDSSAWMLKAPTPGIL